MMGFTRDELAEQLVREAYDAFTNDQSRVDLKDWVKTARGFLFLDPTDRPCDCPHCLMRRAGL
jgi:hypothetical protein